MKRFLRKIKEIIKKIFLSNILFYIILLLLLISIFLYDYIYHNFSNITLDQLVYSMQKAEGTSQSVIINGAKFIMIRFCIAYLIYFVVKFILNKIIVAQSYIRLKIRKKEFKFKLYPFSKLTRLLLILVCIVTSFIYIFNDTSIFLKWKTGSSKFIEKNYVEPRKVKITAPDDKQNLIFIYVESMESTFVDMNNGGAFKKSVTPEMEKLASNNINFSQNDKIGGAYMPTGASWTVAGMIAQTAGVPLKVPMNLANDYSGYGSFLPGAYALGEVLEDNGYHNYLSFGSSAKFGGRKDYFESHGNYTIYDYDYAKEKKWIPKEYRVWWGFEDVKLFEYAKKELTEISAKDEPFNFTLLTANTHFFDGYIDEECDTPFSEKYLNAYYCSDSEIGQFVKWIQEQDFFDNTTVIITGDHLTMQMNITDMFDVEDTESYDRSIYNVFINSRANTKNVKNRAFNSFDIYPTTLAAMGFDIENDKLGLGTNLFSNKKTLVEKYGNEYVNSEIFKVSKFYNDNLLGESYVRIGVKDRVVE